jgi:sialate O-acetylesterase
MYRAKLFKLPLISVCIACFLQFSFSPPLAGDVSLPALFSDNMVIQCGMRLPVWGRAEPGEKVRVRLDYLSAQTVADSGGRWSVSLDPLGVGGPFELVVSGKNTIVVKNVLSGEVWLCSGQSNMAWTVARSLNAEEEIAAANYPKIRHFQVKRFKASQPLEDVAPVEQEADSWLNTWEISSAETVGKFTAVGYFFARALHQRLDVPVGIINSSWGGTVAEAWTAREALETDPELKAILSNWPDYNNDEQWLKEQYAEFTAEVEKARREGRPEPLYFNQPSVLYNGMIAPLIPYPVRGAIWYQGESNAFRAFQYRGLFQTLIRNWRAKWALGDFPFLFVQLANFEAGSGVWPELRQAQSMALSLPKTAMAVTTDIGQADDVHPRNKQEVGRRLALAARAILYGEDIIYSGPVFESMAVEGSRCRIKFTHIGDGLAARGETLRGFTIAGEDKEFVDAEAKIDGSTVVVSSDKIEKPAAVRYAWKDNPQEANLYNRSGDEIYLPASPFRTDDWPGLTAGRK